MRWFYVLVISLFCLGCVNGKYAGAVLTDSDATINEEVSGCIDTPPNVDDIKLEATIVYDTTYHGDCLKIVLINKTGVGINYGEEFRLWRYENEEWKQVKLGLLFHQLAVCCESFSEVKTLCSLSDYFLKPLEKGHYKVEKRFNFVNSAISRYVYSNTFTIE